MTDSFASQPSPRPRRRAAKAHPLLRPFPLVVLALATFLVTFMVLMASLRSASAPLTAAQPSAVSVSGKRLTVTTSASGRRIVSGAPAGSQGEAAAGSAGASAAPVVTSSSGAGSIDD